MINTSLSCVPPIVQLAGKAALEHDAAERDDVMRNFHGKVELLVDELRKVDGVTVLMPAGTFYVFPKVEPICTRLGITSHGLAMYLLEGADDKRGVACLGGECFGAAGQGLPPLQLRRARRAARRGRDVLRRGGHADGPREGVPGRAPEVSVSLSTCPTGGDYLMNIDPPTAADAVVYPDSDGKPMADNTLQWDWMVKIVGELRELFAGQPVFVAGDLFWYPVKGDPKTVTAPDALVAFGRPTGYRGSYKQWEEGGIAPTGRVRGALAEQHPRGDGREVEVVRQARR